MCSNRVSNCLITLKKQTAAAVQNNSEWGNLRD